MTSTAEGVETSGQEAFLRENGCDEIQGYIVSRPKPLENLQHLFAPMDDRTEASERDGVSEAVSEPVPRPRIVAGNQA